MPTNCLRAHFSTTKRKLTEDGLKALFNWVSRGGIAKQFIFASSLTLDSLISLAKQCLLLVVCVLTAAATTAKWLNRAECAYRVACIMDRTQSRANFLPSTVGGRLRVEAPELFIHQRLVLCDCTIETRFKAIYGQCDKRSGGKWLFKLYDDVLNKLRDWLVERVIHIRVKRNLIWWRIAILMRILLF